MSYKIDNSDGIILNGFVELTSGGDLNIDSNTLYVDSSTSRVGIGTTAPSSLVHIQGTENQLTIETSGGGELVEFDHRGNIAITTTSPNVNYFKVDQNATELFRHGGINDHFKIPTGGLVISDVVADDPTGKFQINLDSSETSLSTAAPIAATFRNKNLTNNNYTVLNFQDSLPSGVAQFGVQITDHTSHLADFVWRTGAGFGSERMRITSIGRVGIGTSTPSVRLEVAGGDLAVDTDTLYVDASTDRVGIGTATPSTKLHVITGTGTDGLTIANANETVTIRPDGLSTLSEIATTDIGFQINVGTGGRHFRFNSTTANNMLLYLNGALTGFDMGSNNGTPVHRFYTQGANIGSVVINDTGEPTGDFRVEGDTQANLLFTDASTNRVGINTASPSVDLDVRGSLYVNASQSSAYDFRVSSVNETNQLVVEGSNGSVGIGGWQLAHAFRIIPHSSKSVGMSISNINTTGTQTGELISVTGAATTNIGAQITASGATNNYAIVVPSGGGNVGIGTSTPTEKLHVVGNTKITADLEVDTDTLFVDASLDSIGINTASPSAATALHIVTGTSDTYGIDFTTGYTGIGAHYLIRGLNTTTTAAAATVGAWFNGFNNNAANNESVGVIGVGGNASFALPRDNTGVFGVAGPGQNGGGSGYGGFFQAVLPTTGINYGAYIDAINSGAGDAYGLVVARGNTGLNVALPTETLHMDGNILFADGNTTNTISIALTTAAAADDLSIVAGTSTNVSGVGGDLILSAGAATAGGGAIGGKVFIDGGAGGAGSNNNVAIAANGANGRVGVGISTPQALLHVDSGGGTVPSLDLATILLVQNNQGTGTASGISIIAGNASDSRIYFGDAEDENAGRLDYNHVNNDFQFTTNGVTDNGPSINSVGTLITKGHSVATVFYDVISATTVNPTANSNFILARAQGGRNVATLTIVLPDVTTDGVVDGHVIEVRTLAISTGSITLQASTGGINGFFRLNGTTPVTYPLAQNTSYRFVYESGIGRWVEV